MPRRQSTTSSRRPRRSNSRQLPLHRSKGNNARRAEENDAEMMENAESEDIDEATDRPGTNPTATELIVLDHEEDNTLGNRRRSEKNATPQRGLNKKKARFDLTNDSGSEEEIVFEDCQSTGSSKNSSKSSSSTSADSPPAPRRLCQPTVQNLAIDSDSNKSTDSSLATPEVTMADPKESERPTTVAETIMRNPQAMQPAAPNILKSCRYSAQLLVPPSEEPVKRASELLQKVFSEIQKQAGKQVWLSAWHSREDNLTCKKPTDIPIGTTSDDRDFYTRVFDNYMSLTPDTEKRLFLKIHFITQSPDALKIPLKELGQKLETLKERFGFTLNQNPNPCQCAKVTTIGWGYGTVKAMDTDKLIPAIRAFLKIPDHVALGAQWRTIADQHGKKYPWPKDSTAPRPPQALHFDIDDAYIGVWYPKFSKLWKKGATKKVQYLTIRLVPCFTTQLGKSQTPAFHKATVYMAQKQAHLVNLHTTRLTSSNILSLDTPVGKNNTTLRRYLMMKAPEGLITDRIFISVDQAYRGNDFTLTVPKIYADQALRVLHNMIPECLHLYGEPAARWFTNIGLMAYQDVQWDPLLNVPTSANDATAYDVVDENLFGMGGGWKDALLPEPTTPTVTQIEGINNLGPTVGEILDARARRGINDDVSSFGEVFERSHSGSTIAPPRTNNNTRTRRVGFRQDEDSNTENRAAPNDDATVSTIGTEATTGTTRRTLRHQVEINNALRSEGAQIAEDRDRLQSMLERLQEQMLRHGIVPQADDGTIHTSATPDQPSAIRVPPSTGADSAGGKN